MKQLILMRHAHRDTSHRESDNGLSEKGLKQATLLGKHWEKLLSGKPFALLSSPKKRCQETLAPLADALGAKVKISALLDEQASTEGDVKFNRRIRDFLTAWDESENLITIACSHGDWIPQAIALLTGEIITLKKGGFAIIQARHEKAEKRHELVSVVQSLD